jgi:hypothetical protein
MESGITDAGYNKSIPELVAGMVDPGRDQSANGPGL